MEDLKLARRISERDKQALDALVQDHYPAIFRFQYQLTRNRPDAEDLTQQTIVKAIVGAKNFDGRASLRAWLLGIAFHEFTRHRRRRVFLPMLKDFAAKKSAIDVIDEAEALRWALAKLKPQQRAIFLLHNVEEISLAEIAEMLGIPEGTVKSRLFAARTQLRTYLESGEQSYVPETC